MLAFGFVFLFLSLFDSRHKLGRVTHYDFVHSAARRIWVFDCLVLLSSLFWLWIEDEEMKRRIGIGGIARKRGFIGNTLQFSLFPFVFKTLWGGVDHHTQR